MSVIRIDTPTQLREALAAQEPTYIVSRTRGKVLVPCCNTLLVSPKLIVANLWNPNQVMADRLQLLIESILDNGFCFPVVSIWDDEQELFVVLDGFHRKLVGGEEWLDFDYIPLVVLDHSLNKRMTATMQFNRARGVHQVDLDAEVVRKLFEQGMSDEDIAVKLGMDLEAVHRYKQLTGVAELFKKSEYSMAWEMVE